MSIDNNLTIQPKQILIEALGTEARLTIVCSNDYDALLLHDKWRHDLAKTGIIILKTEPVTWK